MRKQKQPIKRDFCRSRNHDGSQCRRPVHPGTSNCWQHTHDLKAKWCSLTKNQAVTFILTIVSFLLALFSLVLPLEGSTLMGILPGPKVGVTIQELRPTVSNAPGCMIYSIQIASPPDEIIERLNLTVQFPGNIAGYKFGALNRVEFPPGGAMAGLIFAVGKDANGECEVKAEPAPSPDLTATIAGPGMVQVRGARILPRTSATGVFVLSVKPPGFNPATKFAEGSYEYKRLGFDVSKPLNIVDEGVKYLK
jgi:hypothetical protein